MMPPGTTPTSAKKIASFASSRVPNLPFLRRTTIIPISPSTTSRNTSATMMFAAYSHE